MFCGPYSAAHASALAASKLVDRFRRLRRRAACRPLEMLRVARIVSHMKK
jgi:hypothetical protein